MNRLIEQVANLMSDPALPVAIADAVVKSFVVLAVAGALCLCAKRAAAATRHLIWFLAVACLPVLPVLSLTLQRPPTPRLWAGAASFGTPSRVSFALELAPKRHPRVSLAPDAGSPVNHIVPRSPAGDSVSSPRFTASVDRNWVRFGLFVWLGGAAAIGLHMLLGWIRLKKIARAARPLNEVGWTTLLAETARQLRLRQQVKLLQSPDHVMPIVWGWHRPVVLLPAEANKWPLDRKRIVLMHELAHAKRLDSLTRALTQGVCALYWFNPLVWVAANRLSFEQERACDDLVISGGFRASEYASHLVEIAQALRPARLVPGIAVLHPSRLARRVSAITDAARPRKSRPATAVIVFCVSCYLAICTGGFDAKTGSVDSDAKLRALREQQSNQIKLFSTAKEKQARTIAAQANEEILPVYRAVFDAATNGNWQAVTNAFENFKRNHPHYCQHGDPNLFTRYWYIVQEICLAYDQLANGDPEYTQLFVDEIINSIPTGSIYFGGTSPGRGLITAFSKSHADADPFFTLTQNALADGTYREYLRNMYGDRIYIPSEEDAGKCFQEYLDDALRRLRENKLKPGEDVRFVNEDGQDRLRVSGQVVVTSINGLISKIIFDKNPDSEFYVEESFALDWMYPYLEPHRLILKLNRQPISRVSDEVVRRDSDYWTKLVGKMLGNWLTYDTPVQEITAFAEKVYLKRDFKGFKGDPRFVQNDYSHKTFSKLRGAIAGVYAWRAANAASASEKARMIREADFAFRQAFALCPYSQEAVSRYAQLLVNEQRFEDALRVARTSQKFDSGVANLVKSLEQTIQQQAVSPSSPDKLKQKEK